MSHYTLRILQVDAAGLVAICNAQDVSTPRIDIALADLTKDEQKAWATARAGFERVYADMHDTPPDVLAARLDAAIAAKKAEHAALDKALESKRKAAEAT